MAKLWGAPGSTWSDPGSQWSVASDGGEPSTPGFLRRAVRSASTIRRGARVVEGVAQLRRGNRTQSTMRRRP